MGGPSASDDAVEDPAASSLRFSLDMGTVADQALGDDRADALLTVSAASSARAAAGAGALVLIMDTSLSMTNRGKLDEAKRAVCAAIDTLHEGTRLAVVAGSRPAEVIYPPGGGLVRVTTAVKAAAKFEVIHQIAGGGTAIGSWLACARQLFAEGTPPGTVRHAVLYTDGRNEHETSEQLDRTLAECGDQFVCDARGLGDDWDYKVLLRITQALHGDPKAVVRIADLTDDFTRLMRQAQRVVVGRTRLDLRLDGRFQLDFVRQNRPVEAELTGQSYASDDEVHVPLGSWSPGDWAQYQVSLRYAPESLPVEEEIRAARVWLRAEHGDGTWQECAESRPLVVRRRATPAFRNVRLDLTRVEDLRELNMAMRACADAHEDGDVDRADEELRTAVELATALDDPTRLALLHAMAVSGTDGRLRMRRGLPRGEVQRLGLESTRTGPMPADVVDPPIPSTPRRRRCARGHWTTSHWVNFCEECGEPFARTDSVPGGAAAGGGPVGAP